MEAIKLGDLVEVLGQSDDGSDCFWWGEIVGCDSNSRNYELYYIEQSLDNPGVWMYNNHYDTIVKENINNHIRTRKGNYERAWRTAGFVMHRSTTNIYFTPIENHVFEHVYKDSDSNCDSEETLSTIDTWSVEEEDSQQEMIDFIVSDEHDFPRKLI
jgi:hypothetical protein